jgi:glycosyltransferase involved in cell wall biosynthesis
MDAESTGRRLLILCPYYVPQRSGAARHARELALRSMSDGWNVTIYTTDAFDFEYFWDRTRVRATAGSEVDAGMTVRRFPVRHLPFGKLGYFGVRRAMSWLALFPLDTTRLLMEMCLLTPWAPGLYRHLSQAPEFDLVHAYTLPFDSFARAGLRYANSRSIPFVFTPLTHLGESERSPVRESYTLPHQLEMSRRSDRVLAQTSIEKDYLISRGVSAERIVVVGPGVEPAGLRGGDEARLRKRLDLEGPIVLYIGVHAYDKGTLHLIEAMQRLWEQGSTANLVLAGAHFHDFELRFACLPRHAQERCLLLGPVDEAEKRDLLAAADVFAMPSRTDSFGIVYLEAWLYRKPVVGARAGGVPDVITDERDGLLVRFGDVDQLAQAIDRILNDKELARRLGRAGYEKTLAKHTWEHKHSLVRRVYEELLAS